MTLSRDSLELDELRHLQVGVAEPEEFFIFQEHLVSKLEKLTSTITNGSPVGSA
jgi:hypothetical protein